MHTQTVKHELDRRPPKQLAKNRIIFNITEQLITSKNLIKRTAEPPDSLPRCADSVNKIVYIMLRKAYNTMSGIL